MSNIPEARCQLSQMADQIEAGKSTPKDLASDIRKLIHEKLIRRSPARRMGQKSSPVTSEVKNKIIELAENTELHSAEIAAEVGVNPGRVSEILQGDK
jgi:hypothetical protein